MDNIKSKNVFQNKNFLLLFQGSATSNIASIFYSFAVSFYILEITDNNPVIQGAYLGVCGIVFIVCSFLGGILADRWSKVKIIYGTDFIKGIILLLSVVAIYQAIKYDKVALQILILFILGIINNLLAAIFSPAASALLPEIVDKEKLQQANSYFSILRSIEGILGIVLAGILYTILSIEILFLSIGIIYIISGITEVFITSNKQKNTSPVTIKLMFIDFKDGFKYLMTQKAILSLCFGLLFINFFIVPYTGNGLPYLIKTHITFEEYIFKEWLAPEMWSSISTIAISIGSLIMGFIVSYKNKDEKVGKKIKFWLLFIGVLMSLVTISFYLYILEVYSVNVFLVTLILNFFLLGISTIGINIPAITSLQKKIEPDKLAKVMSLVNIGSQGLTPIAALLGGFIISYLGLGALFIFCSVGLLVTAVIISCVKSVNEI